VSESGCRKREPGSGVVERVPKTAPKGIAFCRPTTGAETYAVQTVGKVFRIAGCGEFSCERGSDEAIVLHLGRKRNDITSHRNIYLKQVLK